MIKPVKTAIKLPLISAVESGDFGNVKAVLSTNSGLIDLNESNSLTALSVAVLNGNFEIANYLVSQGADIQRKYSFDSHTEVSLLHLAILGGNQRIVELLVGKGLNINIAIPQTNITPMAVAVENGQMQLAHYLINNGGMPYLEFPKPFNISPVYMKFFQDQLAYRARGDWDGILRDFYVEDCIMISYDFVLRGREAIAQHFKDGNAAAGKLMGFAVESYNEGEGTMIMRSNVLSENTLTKACDSYYFEGDKVKLFFAQTSDSNWPEKTKEWALRWM